MTELIFLLAALFIFCVAILSVGVRALMEGCDDHEENMDDEGGRK